jgi:tetratricopeptide (TPR) repeat protein
MRPNHLLLVTLAGLFLGQPAKAQRSDWEAQVREHVAAHQLQEALQIAEGRLAAAPEDLEAAGWRAHLLAWNGRWQEAEAEYRRLLLLVPRDVDLLIGLANLLTWKKQYGESVSLLANAAQIDANRSDLYVSKGQVFRGLGRTEEARAAFKEALVLQPSNADARTGLASLDDETRYVLHFNTDISAFNFFRPGEAYTTNLCVQINSRWSASISGVGQQLYGQDAGRFLGSATYRLTAHDSLTVGGAVSNNQAVVPKSEGFFEYGRGISLRDSAPVRGVEVSYHQHWFWYQNARVLAVTPSIVLYFARGWAFTLEGTAARSHLSGLSPEWQPSGSSRLDFPLYRSLSGNALFGLGTEDFAMIDQIGRFSARTFGGGLKYSLGARQELTNYVSKQYRSQGETQTSFGFGYAIHF